MFREPVNMTDLSVEEKALWTSLCLVTSLSANREQSARDSVEYVLRIPNPNTLLKSMLARLELNRHQDLTPRERESEEIERKEPSEKHYPICQLERRLRKLITNEYEYRPAYYEEVRCASIPHKDKDVTNEICSSLGLSCVQWNKTIHLTRRRYSSDCWETRTMVIPAGCECMWPIHRLGDMSLHV